MTRLLEAFAVLQAKGDYINWGKAKDCRVPSWQIWVSGAPKRRWWNDGRSTVVEGEGIQFQFQEGPLALYFQLHRSPGRVRGHVHTYAGWAVHEDTVIPLRDTVVYYRFS